MKIIAESSSTRTEWSLVDGDVVVENAFTDGLNPYFQTRREISHIIRLQLPPNFFKKRWEHVHFYGAGCANITKNKIMESSLVAQFKTPVTVESDLLGAARGLLIEEAGLACILGTGSNSCIYNGKDIVRNVRPLGYILGDEGSGAALGKQFVSDCLKGLAPEELAEKFYTRFDLKPDEITDIIFSAPLPNRTLSSYSFFLADHLDNEYVYGLVYDCIMNFFKRNIVSYEFKDYEASFVGAVACTFADVLHRVAEDFGVKIKKIIPRSMPGLVEYHSRNQ